MGLFASCFPGFLQQCQVAKNEQAVNGALLPNATGAILVSMPTKSSMGRTYRKPPLIEAVVEFQFDPPLGGWKSVFAGKMFAEIEAEYPRAEEISGAQLQISKDVGIALGPAPEIHRFLKEDGSGVITVGSDILGISVLPRKSGTGHPGWSWLRDESLRLLKIHQQVVAPKRLRRIGVRYINGVVVEPETFRVERIMNVEAGLVPPSLLNETNPFSYRLQRVREATDAFLYQEVLHVAAQPGPAGTAQLMLDVDQLWTALVESISKPRAILETLHNAVRKIFETAIRPEVLDSFDPIA